MENNPNEKVMLHEDYKKLDPEDQIDDILKRIEQGKGDLSFFKKELSLLKSNIEKTVEDLQKDESKNGASGNNGFWDAEREQIKRLKDKLDKIHQILES